MNLFLFTGRDYEAYDWEEVKNGGGKRDPKPIRTELYEEGTNFSERKFVPNLFFLQTGAYIHLGTVAHISANPSEEQRLMAHRSIPAYKELSRTCLIHVEVNLTPKNQITVISKSL